jgi:hypothetical protein
VWLERDIDEILVDQLRLLETDIRELAMESADPSTEVVDLRLETELVVVPPEQGAEPILPDASWVLGSCF